MAAVLSETSQTEKPARDANGRLLPGNTANPNGRRKNARNRLQEFVINEIADDFEAHGKQVIERVRNEEPAKYLAMAISLLPKDVKVEVENHGPRVILDMRGEPAASGEPMWGGPDGPHEISEAEFEEIERNAAKSETTPRIITDGAINDACEELLK